MKRRSGKKIEPEEEFRGAPPFSPDLPPFSPQEGEESQDDFIKEGKERVKERTNEEREEKDSKGAFQAGSQENAANQQSLQTVPISSTHKFLHALKSLQRKRKQERISLSPPTHPVPTQNLFACPWLYGGQPSPSSPPTNSAKKKTWAAKRMKTEEEGFRSLRPFTNPLSSQRQ